MASEGEPRPRGDGASEKREQRLLALVCKDMGVPIEARPEHSVHSWPYLLVAEYLGAMAVILFLLVLSVVLNAPLEEHSSPTLTPNPSKAPWYFLNLQELLLHMHPALAGAILPTLVILALLVLPYVDRSRKDVGHWFAGEKGKKLALLSAAYSVLVVIGLAFFDEFVRLRALLSWAHPTIAEIVAPLVIIGFFVAVLFGLIARWRPNQREVFIALFTAFVAAYFTMTILSSIFRGPGMHLYWPWDQPNFRLPL